MVMGFYLQNPRNDCLFYSTPSGMRRPLELKYTYPNTLIDAFADYIILWESISKILGVVAYFVLHLQEGDALWK